MKWWTLQINVLSETAEAAAWLIAEALDHPVEVRDETDDSGIHRLLVISFEDEPHQSIDDEIYRTLDMLGIEQPVIQRTSSDDRSWEDGWKEFFHTRVISRRFAVRPPWELNADHPYTIIIDPGLAFGTGTHPTTSGCLSMLDQVLESSTPARILDVGCGSGILGIAASLLGHPVLAIDIDEDAVNNARVNAKLNGVDSLISFETAGPDAIRDTFELVVANIIAPVLLENADIIKATASHQLILSGLLTHQEEAIRKAYSPWVVHKRSTIGDWVILYLEPGE